MFRKFSIGLIFVVLSLLAMPILAQDGRINPTDGNATAYIYCNADQTAYNIFRIENGAGQFALSIAKSDIPAANGSLQLVASTDTIDFYILADGRYRMESYINNTQKYVVEWDGGCSEGRAPGIVTTGRAGGNTITTDQTDTTSSILTTAVPATTSATFNTLSNLPVIGPSNSINTSVINLRTDGYVITNTDQMTLRSGAGADYQALAIVEGGVSLAVTGQNARQTWWRVQSGNGYEGWLTSEFLLGRGNLTNKPVIAVSQMGPKAAPTLVFAAVRTVYNSPTELVPVCTAAPGEYLIYGSNAAGDWLQIQATCTTGASIAAWVQTNEGLLRNPSGTVLPILNVPPPANSAQAVNGPAFIFFSPQFVYERPSTQSFQLCEALPNRYPVLGRNSDTTFYLISAVCPNGQPVVGWINIADGFFQNNTTARVQVID